MAANGCEGVHRPGTLMIYAGSCPAQPGTMPKTIWDHRLCFHTGLKNMDSFPPSIDAIFLGKKPNNDVIFPQDVDYGIMYLLYDAVW